jgi:hypothetical protein
MPRPRRILADTLRRLVPYRGRLEKMGSANRYLRFLLGDEYESLSYVVDWLESFATSPRLQVQVCNVNDLLGFEMAMRRIREFDLVVVLHSAAGDSMSRLESAVAGFGRRRGTLLVLIGNEYSLMKQKLKFLHETGAEFVGSQLPRAAAEWLYSGTGAAVLEAPAGLNPALYRPGPPDRPIDIGFRGDKYRSELIGDEERERIIDYFARSRPPVGLRVDISYERVPRTGWSALLARSTGTVGAESGTYFLERDDATQSAIMDFLATHPEATFDDVYERFWRPKQGAISGKAISSRHFEAIGTKTCQILVEGTYNNILRSGTHYIPVRPDLADIDEGVRRFRDVAERARITEAAHQHAMSAHTYAHRVNDLLDRIIG